MCETDVRNRCAKSMCETDVRVCAKSMCKNYCGGNEPEPAPPDVRIQRYVVYRRHAGFSSEAAVLGETGEAGVAAVLGETGVLR